jgi:amino acid transporter
VTLPLHDSDAAAGPSPDGAAPRAPELHRAILSGLEVFAQSVANIAPTATPTLVIPLVFIVVGGGAWAAYLFALIAISLVALNINQFARRSSSPGNIYTYIALGLGPTAAIAIGWALLIAYVGTASAVTTGFTNYVNVLVQEIFGWEGSLPALALVAVVGLSIFGSWFVAYKDVRISTQLMLVFELVSVALIIVVVAATFLTHHGNLVTDGLLLKGTGLGDLRLGLVLAIFSFVGFESATSLGSEAKNPLQTIPRAVLRSAIFVGVLFIFAAYASVLGFDGRAESLGDSSAPIQDLASFAGLGFLAIPITIGAIVSFFACVLASVTAGARVLFQLGRHGYIHASLGDAHATNGTPHVAVTVVAVVAFVPAAILTGLGNNLFSIYGWVGTTATLAFIVSYIAVSIAAPVYLRRIGDLRARHIAVAAIAVAFLLVAFVGAVYPLPPTPGQWPIIAFVVLLVGGFAFGAVQLRRSAALQDGIRADLDAIDLRVEAASAADPALVATAAQS